MNGTLKVDTSKLRSAASNFSSTSTQIRNATNRMSETVSQISGSIWQGEAASAYLSKFKGLDDEMQKIDKMIQEHVQDLNDMASQYEAAENASVQQAAALKSDIF
jgi:WXG100 family type VII secretion target